MSFRASVSCQVGNHGPGINRLEAGAQPPLYRANVPVTGNASAKLFRRPENNTSAGLGDCGHDDRNTTPASTMGRAERCVEMDFLRVNAGVPLTSGAAIRGRAWPSELRDQMANDVPRQVLVNFVVPRNGLFPAGLRVHVDVVAAPGADQHAALLLEPPQQFAPLHTIATSRIW